MCIRDRNTTAAADVQLVRSYIEIQQLRYKRRAVFTLDADGALESWYLPHLDVYKRQLIRYSFFVELVC